MNNNSSKSSIIQLTQILNTKMFKFISLILILFISSNWVNSPSLAGTTAVGQWQYIVTRGDAHPAKGKLSSPLTCPLYIGYFSLDYKEIRPDIKGRYIVHMDKGEFQVVGKDEKQAYVIGKESFEIKGSYTPTDTNKYCSTPLTNTNAEKAPIFMRKISPSYLEWETDFSQGTKKKNAIWVFSSNYDGKSTMKGTLKAYVCRDKSRKNCNLLNTANFTAKKINSITQASGKPLFSQVKDISIIEKFMNWSLVSFGGYPNYTTFDTLKSKQKESLPITESKIRNEYIKPSILSVMPSFAAADTGLRACQRQQGARTTGSDLTGGAVCAVCRDIPCGGGATPGSPKEGRCFGQNGNSVCVCNCRNCNRCS